MLIALCILTGVNLLSLGLLWYNFHKDHSRDRTQFVDHKELSRLVAGLKVEIESRLRQDDLEDALSPMIENHVKACPAIKYLGPSIESLTGERAVQWKKP